MIFKRGTTYSYSTTLAGRRLRCSLGTRDPRAAHKLEQRISFALAEGPNHDIWENLKPSLPPHSYAVLSQSIGLTALPTLLEFEDLWEKHLDRRLRLSEITESTHTLYGRISRVFFGRMLEQSVRKMDEITPVVIDDYLIWRKESVQSKGNSGRGIVTDSTVLAQMFEFGMQENFIKKSPLKHKPRLDSDPKGPDPFTEEEMSKLEVATTEDDRLAFLLLRWTGLRKTDAAGVTWSAIDWTKKMLTWKTKKRSKWVTVPLHGSLLAELSLHKGEPADRILPFAQNKLYQVIVALGERAGVENCHPHRFRHSFVCHLLGKGASLWDVAQMIGDSHATVERYYGKITSGQQERVRNLLEDFAGQPSGVVVTYKGSTVVNKEERVA